MRRSSHYRLALKQTRALITRWTNSAGATGMWSPNPSEKKRFGYLGYSRVLEGTFCAIATYEKSCHVSRELSPSTAKGAGKWSVNVPMEYERPSA